MCEREKDGAKRIQKVKVKVVKKSKVSCRQVIDKEKRRGKLSIRTQRQTGSRKEMERDGDMTA